MTGASSRTARHGRKGSSGSDWLHIRADGRFGVALICTGVSSLLRPDLGSTFRLSISSINNDAALVRLGFFKASIAFLSSFFCWMTLSSFRFLASCVLASNSRSISRFMKLTDFCRPVLLIGRLAIADGSRFRFGTRGAVADRDNTGSDRCCPLISSLKTLCNERFVVIFGLCFLGAGMACCLAGMDGFDR